MPNCKCKYKKDLILKFFFDSLTSRQGYTILVGNWCEFERGSTPLFSIIYIVLD